MQKVDEDRLLPALNSGAQKFIVAQVRFKVLVLIYRATNTSDPGGLIPYIAVQPLRFLRESRLLVPHGSDPPGTVRLVLKTQFYGTSFQLRADSPCLPAECRVATEDFFIPAGTVTEV